MKDHTIRNSYQLPLPYTYLNDFELPESFTWGNINGVNYLTKSLNQHIPQVNSYAWNIFVSFIASSIDSPIFSFFLSSSIVALVGHMVH